jgi:alkane 1-monooxygenase
MTPRETAAATGFLTILMPPGLLAWGATTGHDWAAFAAVFVLAPLLRPFLAEASEEPTEWSELAATALEDLPAVYVLVLGCALAVALARLRRGQLSPTELIGLVASLFAVFVLASCVAHELLHRRSASMRALGCVLTGVIGYPLLETDHRSHHLLANRMVLVEAPYPDENVWAFSVRRLKAIFRRFAQAQQAAVGRRRARLFLAVAAMATTATVFGLVAGLSALMLYLCVAVLTTWSLQAITYLQHWGLGTAGPSATDFGWEDRCRLQQWLTLGISFHEAHHSAAQLPFYRLVVHRGSPRMPASYAVLFAACLCPPLHRAIMKRALERWQQQSEEDSAPRRRVFCGRSTSQRR